MRRARQERGRSAARRADEQALNRPFSALARTLRVQFEGARPPGAAGTSGRRTRPTSGVAAIPHAGAAPPGDDPELFVRAMSGVARLEVAERQRVARPAPASELRAPVPEEVEALETLSGLVAGDVQFDVSDTREYVEGAVAGLDPRVVRQLRRGELAWQAHLDLHGMTAAEARPAVERFLAEAVRAGRRCVLIVHGRGHNSKDHTPVLKTRLVGWLSRGALSRMVLAFTTARPHDGGAGALYVLLRRDRRRRPFHVGSGTTA